MIPVNYFSLVRELSIIIGLCFIGTLFEKLFNLPLPGNLIGMLLLTVLLLTNTIKLNQVEHGASLLLDNMILFFIPAGVGLVLCSDLLCSELGAIVITTLVSTLLVLGATGKTIDVIIKYNQRKEASEHD